jgi:hypothetical protein
MQVEAGRLAHFSGESNAVGVLPIAIGVPMHPLGDLRILRS